MGKYFVPFTSETPADRVREALDQAENVIANLRGTGSQALELLHLLDQADQGLKELREVGADVRAEEARFETVQLQLRGRRRRFMAEVGGAALREERERVRPDEARWWWFLDEALAEDRRRRLRRVLIGTVVTAVVLAVAWVLYDRFLAPPPNVREAFQRSSEGQALAEQGDMKAALAAFDAAVALDPSDPEQWVWKGVAHAELGETEEARQAFDTARSLYDTELAFLLGRSMAYLRVGDVEAASADAEEAVARYPKAGWAYSLRASVAVEQEDYAAAIDDLEKAADLAAASGDTQLEAYARTQRAMVIQLRASQPVEMGTAEPGTEEKK